MEYFLYYVSPDVDVEDERKRKKKFNYILCFLYSQLQLALQKQLHQKERNLKRKSFEGKIYATEMIKAWAESEKIPLN